MKTAVLGIPGSYHHQVAVELGMNTELLHCSSFKEVVEAVSQKKVERGVIAVENSLIGTLVDAVELIQSYGLTIEFCYTLCLDHRLVTSTKTELKEIRTVISHPAALKQCSQKITMMKWQTKTVMDTASAVQQIMKETDKTLAAISSTFAAQLYGAYALDISIQDDHSNSTTFAVIKKKGSV